jgi:hypothetical protein
MPPQAHQTSQYVVSRGGIFLGKWGSALAGTSDGKMTIQSACALNTLYLHMYNYKNKLGSYASLIALTEDANLEENVELT